MHRELGYVRRAVMQAALIVVVVVGGRYRDVTMRSRRQCPGDKTSRDRIGRFRSLGVRWLKGVDAVNTKDS